MSENDMPSNTMSLVMQLQDDGNVHVMMCYNMSKDLDESEKEYYINMIEGLHESLPLMADYFSMVGEKFKQLEDMESLDEEIAFEPSPELMQKISDNKIVAFKKKMH